MYSKWDNLDDSDDEADNALEKAQALNERGSKLLTGQGKAAQPEAALECFEQACKQLLHNGKPISSDARDLAGGVMLNMAVAAHELKRHSPVESRAVLGSATVGSSRSPGTLSLGSSRWPPSLPPHACRLPSRRHESVVTHAAAVLDLEPANAYDRGQAHMWCAVGRQALGDLRGAIEDLKARLSP